jgi:hypothetical protein
MLPAEVLAKLKDSLLMFWESLSFTERRYVSFVILYASAVAFAALTRKAGEMRKQEILREVLELVDEQQRRAPVLVVRDAPGA